VSRRATFSFWGTADRVNYCGRRYYSAGVVHGTPGSLAATVSGHPSWRTVGHTFVLRAIEAPVTAYVAAGGFCTMAVYVPRGHDTFTCSTNSAVALRRARSSLSWHSEQPPVPMTPVDRLGTPTVP